MCPGPEDGFQGKNEQLGIKGWQPHRIKFLTAHDPSDGGRNECTANVQPGAAELQSL